jgi:hypothetical protein
MPSEGRGRGEMKSASWTVAVLAGVVTALVAVALACSGAAQARSSCGSVGQERPDGDGGWGAYRIRASRVSCETARRAILACGTSRREPAGWVYREVVPGGGREQLVGARGRAITWTPVQGWARCPAPGRRCSRATDFDGTVIATFAAHTTCRHAERARELWLGAGASRPKDRPGSGWRCTTTGEDGTDDISRVRCERGRQAAYWTYS